jgi:hypothetical protein
MNKAFLVGMYTHSVTSKINLLISHSNINLSSQKGENSTIAELLNFIHFIVYLLLSLLPRFYLVIISMRHVGKMVEFRCQKHKW